MKKELFKFVVVLCLFIFNSCKSKGPSCAITLNDLLQSQKSIVYEVSPNVEFREVGKDSMVGGRYIFYPNGNLKEYKFFVNKDSANYRETYDSLGRLKSQLGNPLVYKALEKIGDSLGLRFYFSMPIWDYDSLGIKDSASWIPLPLTNDSLFSNIQVARYTLTHSQLEKGPKATLIAVYKNKCTGEKTTLRDSIHY